MDVIVLVSAQTSVSSSWPKVLCYAAKCPCPDLASMSHPEISLSRETHVVGLSLAGTAHASSVICMYITVNCLY